MLKIKFNKNLKVSLVINKDIGIKCPNLKHLNRFDF